MKSPFSNHNSCELIKEIDVQAIAKRWKSELGIDWTPPHGVHKFQYWRDQVTGFYFYTPHEVTGKSDLYQQLQKFSWYYMQDKWEFSKAIQVLRSHKISNNSRLLEIGVGKAFFLEKAKLFGLDVAGVELNPDAAALARGKGFQIFEDDLSSLAQSQPSAWDIICSFQVLEHLSNPRDFLEQSLALLKPNGFLILSVPNAAVSRYLDPNREDLLDQPPHHMGHWDASVFSALEGLLPLKVKTIAFEPLAPYHINWFVGSWSNTIRLKFGNLAGQLILNRLTAPIVSNTLAAGLRHLVKGHTLLVCLQKLG